MKPIPEVCLACIFLPLRCLAFLGVGDIVYDPANVAQTVNVVRQVQQEYDRLGTLLGVSTQQLDQLLQVASVLGNATEAAPYRAPTSTAGLESLVQANPGMESATLGALFNSNSQLDAFLGVPIARWIQAVEDPNGYYRTILVDPAITRVGGAVGLDSAAISYVQWYAAHSGEDQYNLGPAAASDLTRLLESDWLGQARQRRINLQGLAAANRDDQAKAIQAATVTDQAHVQAQLNGNTNSILLESAAQATDASEAALRAAGAQREILQDANEGRRNEDEIRLNLPP